MAKSIHHPGELAKDLLELVFNGSHGLRSLSNPVIPTDIMLQAPEDANCYEIVAPAIVNNTCTESIIQHLINTAAYEAGCNEHPSLYDTREQNFFCHYHADLKKFFFTKRKGVEVDQEALNTAIDKHFEKFLVLIDHRGLKNTAPPRHFLIPAHEGADMQEVLEEMRRWEALFSYQIKKLKQGPGGGTETDPDPDYPKICGITIGPKPGELALAGEDQDHIIDVRIAHERALKTGPDKRDAQQQKLVTFLGEVPLDTYIALIYEGAIAKEMLEIPFPPEKGIDLPPR